MNKISIMNVSYHLKEVDDTFQMEHGLHAENGLVFSPDTDAKTVASCLDDKGLDVALIGDTNSDAVFGVFVRDHFRHQLARHKGLEVRSATEGLTKMLEDPNEVVNALQHEWLNHERPVIYWCDVCRTFNPTDHGDQHG